MRKILRPRNNTHQCAGILHQSASRKPNCSTSIAQTVFLMHLLLRSNAMRLLRKKSKNPRPSGLKYCPRTCTNCLRRLTFLKNARVVRAFSAGIGAELRPADLPTKPSQGGRWPEPSSIAHVQKRPRPLARSSACGRRISGRRMNYGKSRSAGETSSPRPRTRRPYFSSATCMVFEPRMVRIFARSASA